MLLTQGGGLDEEELVRRAADLGVKVYGMSGYFIHPESQVLSSTVLLGYASPTEDDIRLGTGLLREAWERDRGKRWIAVMTERTDR